MLFLIVVFLLACTCNVAGTGLGGNSSCDRRDGVCQCKANVAGHLCDVCKVNGRVCDVI